MSFIQGFLQQRLLEEQGWQRSIDSFPKHVRHTLEGSGIAGGWQSSIFLTGFVTFVVPSSTKEHLTLAESREGDGWQ